MVFIEKRNFSREKVSSETRIVPIGKNQVDNVNCITCNISEGGIKIITDKQLEFEKYNIIMANQKFPVKVVYRTPMDNNQFLTGLMFARPISDMLKKEIIINLNKKLRK